MKKTIACLLALPLALSACGAQTSDAVQSAPPAETTQTTETAPETSAPAVGTAGRLRRTSILTATDTGLYTVNEKWNAETGIETFYLFKTDYDTAVQQKITEIELPGGMYCSMAVWDDTVELYLFENADKDDPTEWCYMVDASTGSVERELVGDDFWPAWYDDAALYEMDYNNGPRIIRRDRATHEVSYISLPQQSQSIAGVGDKWLVSRIVSPSPLPNDTEVDMYEAVLQNSEKEFDLLDAATGELQKLYSYPAVGEEYSYYGQYGGTLYFQHRTPDENENIYPSSMDKLENGEMVQVLAKDNKYVPQHTMEDELGELQWVAQEDGDTVKIYNMSDGQTYHAAFKVETGTSTSTGYPEMLLPGGRVLVTYGSTERTDFLDQVAYAIIDRTAYLAGSTDYTPVTMYTGE